MQLPISKSRQTYIEEIKIVETNLKEATVGEVDKPLLLLIQKRIDFLAEKYQYDADIGTARYKLYELQALLHYFNEHDDDALDFINQAIDMRGESYDKAEKLKGKLSPGDSYLPKTINPDKMTKEQRHDKKIGVEGWLAFYVVGLFIGTGVTVFNLFNGGVGLSSSDISNLNEYQYGLGDSLSTITIFENIALIVYAGLMLALAILIIRKKRVAKNLAIATLIFGAMYSIIDYAVVSSIFDSSNLTQYVQEELNSSAGYAGRNIIIALLWIPYFAVSKRVKRTLTK